MSYPYNGFGNPYARPMPNYNQPQFMPPQQPQQMAQPQMQMPMQQPVMPQPQQMTMQQPAYEMPIQYVGNGTIKEAEGYILFPNQKAIFIDRANGMVYEKICGNDGQSAVNYFKRVDFENESKPAEPIKEEPNTNMAEYVKKSELDGFVTVEQYKELKELYNGLRAQIKASKRAVEKETDKLKYKGEE